MVQMVKTICNAGDPGSIPPWEREWLSTPVFLPGELHGQRSLVGPVHGVSKSHIRHSVVNNTPVNAGDIGSIPGSVRSSREGNGNPL